jgi:flagellar biosynthesis protein FlhF
MVIKKYLVKNISEGLTRIRYELGKDAIIISQRKVRKPGLKGLFSKKVIEVTAAVENSSNQDKNNFNQDKNYLKKDEEFQNSLESIKRLMQDEVSISREPVRFQETEKHETLNNRIFEHNSNIEKEFSKVTKEKENEKIEDTNIEAIHKEVSELKSLFNKAACCEISRRRRCASCWSIMPAFRSASMAICRPGMPSKAKRAATSLIRVAPLVITTN